jgi:hypothetical protein
MKIGVITCRERSLLQKLRGVVASAASYEAIGIGKEYFWLDILRKRRRRGFHEGSKGDLLRDKKGKLLGNPYPSIWCIFFLNEFDRKVIESGFA